MATISEERERLRRELHEAVKTADKTIAETLTVDYDPEHRIRQRLLALASNILLGVAGSKYRARIVKGKHRGIQIA